LLSTIRRSSRSSSIVSLGKGVAVISVTPSAERHIDAAQVSKIGQSLQRSLANHRHYPAGRSIIDQVREIFGHPDGYAGATRGFELDDSAVYRYGLLSGYTG